jgi:hypothetical protein
MVAYHVFVDGSVDVSAEGKERLAAAIAAHYGLPIADLYTRIASGRFRVKGNADRATADTYVQDLEALGARCSIEAASAANVSKTPLPFPAVTPVGMAVERTTSGSKNFQSGLSAAFSGEQAQGGLGVLDDNASVFSLSSVDGSDRTDAPPATAFAPPPPHAVGNAPPAADRVVAAPQSPIDMFAPPDADDDNAEVNLEPEPDQRAAKRHVEQPATDPVDPVARPSRPSIQAPAVAPGPRPGGLADPKIRFAAGVLIAILVGFVPAHVVASMRERSAYAEIDAKVDEVQKQADAPDTYASLDAFRATQLEHKHEDRRTAALLALLIWAAGAAGVAFVWFKKIAPPTA